MNHLFFNSIDLSNLCYRCLISTFFNISRKFVITFVRFSAVCTYVTSQVERKIGSDVKVTEHSYGLFEYLYFNTALLLSASS